MTYTFLNQCPLPSKETSTTSRERRKAKGQVRCELSLVTACMIGECLYFQPPLKCRLPFWATEHVGSGRQEEASPKRAVHSKRGEVKTWEVLDAGVKGSGRQRPPFLFDSEIPWTLAPTSIFTLGEMGLLTKTQVL